LGAAIAKPPRSCRGDEAESEGTAPKNHDRRRKKSFLQQVQVKESASLPRRLRRAVGLAPAEPKFFLPSIRLGAVLQHYKNKHIKRGEAFNASHYTRHEYLKAFSPDLLAFANDQLNPELLDRLGYQMVGV